MVTVICLFDAGRNVAFAGEGRCLIGIDLNLGCNRLLLAFVAAFMIFGVFVDVPDIIDPRAGIDIFNGQHCGHHRMILVVVPVHPVTPDHMQRWIFTFQFAAHRLDIGCIAFVIDGIGFFLTDHSSTDNILRITKAKDRHFFLCQLDQISIAC